MSVRLSAVSLFHTHSHTHIHTQTQTHTAREREREIERERKSEREREREMHTLYSFFLVTYLLVSDIYNEIAMFDELSILLILFSRLFVLFIVMTLFDSWQ